MNFRSDIFRIQACPRNPSSLKVARSVRHRAYLGCYFLFLFILNPSNAFTSSELKRLNSSEYLNAERDEDEQQKKPWASL